MSFAAIVIGTGLAVGAGSAYLNYKGSKDATSAQRDALSKLGFVDIPALNQLATQTDLTKFAADFKAQADLDPQFAALRKQGVASVLSALASNADPNSSQNQGITALTKSVIGNTGDNQSVIAGLLSKAKEELAAGATLPPAFQAEMIRSGLASGGAAGTGVTGEGATGVGVRTLLGSAGINLQAQRQQQAESAAGAAGSMEQQQAAALAELTQLSSSLNAAKAGLGGSSIGIATAAMPSIGLSGGQAADIAVGNQNQKNQTTLAGGNLNAQDALNRSGMWSSALGSLGAGITSGAGWLNGLMSTSPAPAGAIRPTISDSRSMVPGTF